MDESYFVYIYNYTFSIFIFVCIEIQKRGINMNFRLIIFSGIMAALIGAMMGLAVTKIAQRIERKKFLLLLGLF